MSASLLTLLKILSDEDKEPHERVQAGLTLEAHVRTKVAQINRAELTKARKRVAQEAAQFVKRGSGEA